MGRAKAKKTTRPRGKTARKRTTAKAKRRAASRRPPTKIRAIVTHAPMRDEYGDLQAHLDALDDVELPRVEADIRRMEAADHPLTVSIDCAAVQLNGLSEAPPLLDPDEAEELADDLLLAVDAARQAIRDGYAGPAVVVELELGPDLVTPIPSGADPVASGDPAPPSCEACSTSDGCEEHRMFTCENCGKQTTWIDGADDDGPGVCSDCWLDANSDLQAGGPALTTAEVYDLWRASEPDLRDDDDEGTERLIALAVYELDRASEPDCRDEDGPEVERLMAEVEAEPGPATKRYLDFEAEQACRRAGLPGDEERADG